MNVLPKISVVVITYERFALLEQTVLSFREQTDYPNLEVIVTDDGSSAETLRRIETLPIDRLIRAVRPRSGLGANTNRGIRAATGDFILHLQDDFLCHGPSDYLRRAVAALQAHPWLGMVRFCGVSGGERRWAAPDETGLSVVLRPTTKAPRMEQQIYSDWPHLKGRGFIEALGEYREGIRIGETELDYMCRFLRQHDFEIGFFPGLNEVFEHTGVATSFRTGNLHYRMQEKLAGLALPLKERAPGLHRLGRRLWRKIPG